MIKNMQIIREKEKAVDLHEYAGQGPHMQNMRARPPGCVKRRWLLANSLMSDSEGSSASALSKEDFAKFWYESERFLK